MRILFAFFILPLCAMSAFSQQVAIIPQPVSLQTRAGKFSITPKTVLAARDEQDRKTAGLLNEYLQQVYGFKLDIGQQESKNYIRFNTKKFIKAPDKDAYSLTVSQDGVSIDGDTYAGTFYGMQTLIQLLPAGNQTPASKQPIQIPYVTVQDYPRFSYRGMHLDVGRHFFPVSFVKRYIDYIALHKMNFFHWHLTEDQGWRIEIKKYPRLTEVGAYRNGTIIGRYPGTGNDNMRYGGFYTQEDVKEIVQYAAVRHITVVPEIEMPGHSSAAIAAYPWLSCFPDEETNIPAHPSLASQLAHRIPTNPNDTSGRQIKLVQETWGVFDDVFCAGKDSTFRFLQDVLDEVIPLFPSQYVHVGGDECPKANWKRCPQCQARMKREGLKDEHELQSYFIQRMEKYLNSKGKTLIGWDEILEGGLAPNAWVMSWRGEQGGIDAARQNHNAIMTPGGYVYLDHSQTRNEDSVTIGGFTPVDKTYSYEPVPKELSPEQATYIKGGQGNVWTEYIKNPSKVEYMIFPRMSALSEVLWSPKEKKSWGDFEKRLQVQFKRYDLWKANYSRAYFDLESTVALSKNKTGIVWKLKKKSKGAISYRLPNNKTVTVPADSVAIHITQSGLYQAWLGQAGAKTTATKALAVGGGVPTPAGPVLRQAFSFNKATGKKIAISKTPHEKYPGQGGAFSLVNGVYSHKGLSYPDWLGWVGGDMEATIDLGKKTNFSSVRVHTLEQTGSWVYLPQYVEVFVSLDGKNFTSAGKSSEFVKDTLTMGWITISFPDQSARYLKCIAKNYGVISEGKPGTGNKAWLFADEIQVY